MLHALIYPYVLISFFIDRYYTEEDKQETLEARLVWIPMDCILTSCVVLYYFIYLYHESKVIDDEYDSDEELDIVADLPDLDLRTQAS